ncbi:hypothetical protein WOLCODRAFT_162076 [Wolfiporia cocos MD-104 SS10]|uniref:Uncharacterized protein n=1 Tax=Wolfiporia cocos (strain MD-104) TaxID=742152 RepID=A0A2H3JQP5_WOLCO|nr:hypothetical protein WOLCODRAFT_162076 [Wolfiporia cocos MD-104 SS10]
MSSSPTPTTPATGTPPTLSSTASETASATTSNANSGSHTTPSSLYLFTFLATLFLLLFVSGAIVLRSFILRRRFRRRIEEAIAAGVVLAPQNAGSSRSYRKLEKPELWDALLAPAADDAWRSIMPVAAKTSFLPSPGAGSGSPDPASTASPLQSATTPSRSLLRPFVRRRTTAPPSQPLTPVPTSPQPQSESVPMDLMATSSAVQVTVLIQMPNPHRPARTMDITEQMTSSLKGKKRSSYWEDEEEEEGVPDVVLGVAQASCNGPISSATGRRESQ